MEADLAIQIKCTRHNSVCLTRAYISEVYEQVNIGYRKLKGKAEWRCSRTKEWRESTLLSEVYDDLTKYATRNFYNAYKFVLAPYIFHFCYYWSKR